MTELPAGSVIVGRSELDSFRQCPLLHHLRYRLGYYRPGTHGDDSAPSQGTRFHSVLQAVYEAIRGGERDVLALARIGGAQVGQLARDLDLNEDQVGQLMWMLENYLKRWGADDDWEIVDIERTMYSPIWETSPGPDDWHTAPYQTRYWLRWTADLVVRVKSLRNRIVIVDTKCVGQKTGHGDADLDDQLGLYQRGWSRLYPDDPALYAMFNRVRREKLVRPMTLEECVWRNRTARTARELDEIERDALSDIRWMYSAANIRRPSSHPDPRQCSWKCDFLEAHLVLRKSGGDWSRVHDLLAHKGFSRDAANDPALGIRQGLAAP